MVMEPLRDCHQVNQTWAVYIRRVALQHTTQGNEVDFVLLDKYAGPGPGQPCASVQLACFHDLTPLISSLACDYRYTMALPRDA